MDTKEVEPVLLVHTPDLLELVRKKGALESYKNLAQLRLKVIGGLCTDVDFQLVP